MIHHAPSDNSCIGSAGHDATCRRAIIPPMHVSLTPGRWVRMRTVIRTRMLTGVEKLSLLCTVCNPAGTLVLLQYLYFITAAAAPALQANIAALCLATRSDTRIRCVALQMFAVCDLKQTRNSPTGTQIRKPRCCSFNVSSRLINSDRLGTKLYL